MAQKVPAENLGLRVIEKAVSSSLSTKEKGEKERLSRLSGGLPVSQPG